MHHINASAPSPSAQRLRLDPSLFYEPPYERPLEDTFAWHLVKYLTPVDGLFYQVRAETPCAPCWIDFVIELNGRRIGFEIGDLDDPQPDVRQEQLRDALVVGSHAVDVLYRLRAADVLDRLHEVLYLIARWEPELFSHRGHVNLRTLAAPEVDAVTPAADATHLHVPLGPDEAVVLRRTCRDVPSTWVRRYDEALAIYGTQVTARRA